MRPWLLPLLLLLLLSFLMLVAGPFPVAAQQRLAPIGTANPPYRATGVEQMAYDATNQTVYLAAFDRHAIIRISQVTTMPLVPSNAAPWAYRIAAGRDGTEGTPGPSEVNATTATFNVPTGVAGWPQYAVGPDLPAGFNEGAASEEEASWVGLWVADFKNEAVRFINFQRGGNVTLVAGSGTAVPGALDGIGGASLLNRPRYLAWGRFLRRTVDAAPEYGSAGSTTTSTAASWTSVVYWTEYNSHCLRQGVPLSAVDLPKMVLNVSTFAGVCGDNGNGVGRWVFNRTRMFTNPWGVVLVVMPFLNSNTTTSTATTTAAVALFVGDSMNYRISMVAPMYPPSARTLTEVYRNRTYIMTGVAVGRVRGRGLGELGVELVVSTGTPEYLNLTVSVHPVNESVGLSQGAAAATMVVLAASPAILWSRHTAVVRYTPNSTFEGSLVVFSGWSFSNGDSLEFYCCLGVEFSERLLFSSGEGAAASRGGVPRRSASIPTKSTRTATTSRSLVSGDPLDTPTVRPRGSTASHHERTVVASMTTYWHARKVIGATSATLTGLRRGAGYVPPQDAVPVLFTGSGASTEVIVGSSTAAGVAASATVTAAASKAAVAGRTAVVWRCSVVGPARAATDDPQQFISFGISLGSPQDGEGSARAALVLTTWLRVLMAVIFAIISKMMI